ncbi:MAG: hypothetical protein R3F65_18070 [bacterium]
MARNALTRGAFHSAAGQRVGALRRVEPALGQAAMTRHPAYSRVGGAYASLQERVALFGPTPRGMALLSDVTTSGEARWRSGNVARVFAVVLRALWQPAATCLRAVGAAGLGSGAHAGRFGAAPAVEADGLDGRSAAEAFSVVCDRSTMSQSDLDAGRLVAVVSLGRRRRSSRSRCTSCSTRAAG